MKLSEYDDDELLEEVKCLPKRNGELLFVAGDNYITLQII